MSTYRINIEIIDQEVENVMRILPFEAKSIIFRFVAKHIAELITEKPEEFIQLYSMAAKKDIDSMMILTGLKKEEDVNEIVTESGLEPRVTPKLPLLGVDNE